jgi:hypothetical protein
VPGATLLSPHVVRDVAAGGGAASALHARVAGATGAANLCASAGVPDAVVDRCIDVLLERRGLPDRDAAW